MPATKLPPSMHMELDCMAPACEGGRIKHQSTRIDPKVIDHHLKHHAYARRDGAATYPFPAIGADCDCPRIIDKPVFSTCLACKGTGRAVVHLTIPKPGNKVRVRDEHLLADIFGKDAPDDPGIVFDVQEPDEHHLELKTGIGVRVTWDELTTTYKIPKDAEVALWTFDLTELELVR